MQTYEKILEKMSSEYTALSGCNADDASDIGIRLKLLAGELSYIYAELDSLESQLFPQSSDGKFLDLHAEQKGLTRKVGEYASGILLFERETPPTADISIPKGTIVSIKNPQRDEDFYITTAAGVMKSGTKEAQLPARASLLGIGGNCAAGRITAIVSGATGITSVTNPIAFSGGRGQESDESFRKRVLESFKNISNGGNVAFYYNTAINHPSVLFAKVIPKKRGVGTVDVIIECLSTVDTDQTVSEIQKIMDHEREICVNVVVSPAVKNSVNLDIQLQVMSGYDFEYVKSECERAAIAFVGELGIGQPLLLNHLGSHILGVSGVLNYRFAQGISDIFPLQNHILTPGNLNIVTWG